MKKLNNKVWSEILYGILSGVISLILAYIIFDLKHIDLNVPFTYVGDAMDTLKVAQNFITGGGRFLFPNMGAPGMVTTENIPDICTIQYFCMWLLSFVIKRQGLLVNVYYLLTFVTISASTTISLRILRNSVGLSILGGILYAFLPYHFLRGESHIFLSTYAMVPLTCVLTIWMMNGELNFNNFKNNKNRIFIAIIIALYIGFNNTYYIYFAGILMSFSTIVNFIKNRDWVILKNNIKLLLITIVSIVINLIPYFIARFENLKYGLEGTRTLRDVELYSLKFSQLVLPIQNHRIDLFAKIRQAYDNSVSISINENIGSTLGIFMSIGLILSIFIIMCVRKHEDDNIISCAILNVFILVLASVGGISSIIVFILKDFRCYNRLSVFVAFYSLVTIIYYLESILMKIPKDYFRKIIIILIGCISILDITPKSYIQKDAVDYNSNNYYMHEDFIRDIENITPKESMIFQLPFIGSNYHTGYKKMGVYQQFYPFIHSTKLKWSYRAQSGSTAEKWQKKIASLPTEQMLKYLASVKFSGIYIDCDGYEDDEADKLIDDIARITNVQPIYSNNRRLVYFYLDKYMEELRNSFDKQEQLIYSNWENMGYTLLQQKQTNLNVSDKFYDILLDGWSNIEDWGVWSDGNNASIGFCILEKHDIEVDMKFEKIIDPLEFDILVNNRKIGEYSITNNQDSLKFSINKDILEETNNLFNINIEFQIKNPKSPNEYDNRLLGIGLKELNISIK